MAMFQVTEKVLRYHRVEAETEEEAREIVQGGEVDGGEEYSWEVMNVALEASPGVLT